MHRNFARGLIAALLMAGGTVQAADYRIDPSHSFVRFKIQHLGYSWMWGGFNDVDGNFTYDAANPGVSNINLTIQTASVDTNHAERDKHLRSDDFLDVKRYPTATFKSTKFAPDGTGGTLEGELTLHGVTRPISVRVDKIGEGPDPWGGYRAGFLGTASLNRGNFGMKYDLGPKSESMDFELGIEGIRK
jgi:polyisoprenoid-binding protein YceI